MNYRSVRVVVWILTGSSSWSNIQEKGRFASHHKENRIRILFYRKKLDLDPTLPKKIGPGSYPTEKIGPDPTLPKKIGPGSYPTEKNRIRILPYRKNRIRILPYRKNRIRILPYRKNRSRILPYRKNRIRINLKKSIMQKKYNC